MFLDKKKLLNTILHSKVINTQLEVELVLSCLGVDSGQTLPKSLQAINRKDCEDRDDHKNRDDHKDRDNHKNRDDHEDRDDHKNTHDQKYKDDKNKNDQIYRVDHKVKEVMPSSIGPLILQFTQLEESNFKNQFFITRSSFQVIYLFYVKYNTSLFFLSKLYKVCFIYFTDSLQSFNARIWKYGIQEN